MKKKQAHLFFYFRFCVKIANHFAEKKQNYFLLRLWNFSKFCS